MRDEHAVWVATRRAKAPDSRGSSKPGSRVHPSQSRPVAWSTSNIGGEGCAALVQPAHRVPRSRGEASSEEAARRARRARRECLRNCYPAVLGGGGSNITRAESGSGARVRGGGHSVMERAGARGERDRCTRAPIRIGEPRGATTLHVSLAVMSACAGAG